MNQKGWTNYGINLDTNKIKEKIDLGGKYLFIYDDENLKDKRLQSFINNKIGEFKGIKIYAL